MTGPLDERLLPGEEDVRFYREHGWYITPKLFSKEELEAAREGVRRHHAGERDHELGMEVLRRADWHPGDPHPLRINDYVALLNRQLRSFVENPLLAATAARLAGAEEIRLWQSGVIHKDPVSAEGETTIGWHTDGAYWRCCTSERMLTAWVPLHDCDEAMGTLVVLDGSHRWQRTPMVGDLLLGRTFLGTDQAELESRIKALGERFEPVPQTLEAGQVSFHHSMALHASGRNLTTRPRIAVVVDLQDGENRYQSQTDENGELFSHSNNKLCRRLSNEDPDYSDPQVFPRLWPPAQ